MTARLCYADGEVFPLRVDRWTAPATPEEQMLLRAVEPPVLDVGCGPGRHVKALAERGVIALGIDVSAIAVGIARRTGAPVLERSIFENVPAMGRWGTTLLLDGSIGIGGDPVTLLLRLRELIRAGGRVLVELEADGPLMHRGAAWIEKDGVRSETFPWARVSRSGIGDIACSTGFDVHVPWKDGDRCFAQLDAR
jgi:SAM-dependent methyltransferase